MTILLSRRWLLFAVVVVLAAWGAWALGQWQFHRLDERRQHNAWLHRNLHAPPVPAADVMAVGKQVAEPQEWRRITLHGTWDDAHTIVIKYQTNGEGAPGVDVVTPLVTSSGPVAVVDRGWMPSSNNGGTRPATPAVAPGQVTVTGWLRRDATGDSTRVVDLAARAVSSRAMAEVLHRPVYGGFVDLDRQSPAPTDHLLGHELPDENDEGPHFFYGLQWWFFGALAVGGFCFLLYEEVRQRRSSQGTLESTQHPAVDRQHRAGDEP